MTIAYALGRLPPRFRYSVHNLLAHPLSEVLHLLGMSAWSERVHDCTVPMESP